RQVQVLRRSLPQMVIDLPTVHLHHTAMFVENRDDQAAVEVLVAALAEDSKTLELFALLDSDPLALRWQTIGEGAVREAETESLDQLRMHQPALFQVRLRLRTLLQGPLIEGDHPLERFRILDPRLHHA